MAFAYVQSAFAQDDTNDNSIAVSLTGVGSSSLVVLLAKWEGAPTTISTINDTTSNATIYGTYNDHGGLGDMSSGFGYYLTGNSGDRTYTATLAASRPYKWLYALEFSYTGTASLDVVDVSAEGAGATLTSGAITTTGTDEVVIGWAATYSGGSYDSETIGGSAATGLGTEPSAAHASYRILTATMSSGTAVMNRTDAPSWIISILSFKAAAAAGRSTKNTRSWPLGVAAGMGFRMPV